MKELLEVGDVLYTDHEGWRDHRSIFGKVERVTNTQAIISNVKFKRDIDKNGSVYKIGETSWARQRYYLATPEIIAEIREETIRRKKEKTLSSITKEQISKLSDDEIDCILNMINSYGDKDNE